MIEGSRALVNTGAFSRLPAGRGLDERPYLDGAAEPVATGDGVYAG
jgi:hypothetical protein